MRNPAEEAELARLIAEQKADDSELITTPDISLDAPLGDEGSGSFHEVLPAEEDAELLEVVGDETVGLQKVGRKRITHEQRKEWRWLRVRKGWTYQQIADYAGVRELTVRRHMPRKRKIRRASPSAFQLSQREKRARQMYEAGATLMEIAEMLYQECGYASAPSCYQGLRKLFHDRKIPVRIGGPTFTVERRLRSAHERIVFLETRLERLEAENARLKGGRKLDLVA